MKKALILTGKSTIYFIAYTLLLYSLLKWNYPSTRILLTVLLITSFLIFHVLNKKYNQLYTLLLLFGLLASSSEYRQSNYTILDSLILNSWILLTLFLSFYPTITTLVRPSYKELKDTFKKSSKIRIICYLTYAVILILLLLIPETLLLTNKLHLQDIIKKTPLSLLILGSFLPLFQVSYNLFKLEEFSSDKYKNEAIYPDQIYRIVSAISYSMISFSFLTSLANSFSNHVIKNDIFKDKNNNIYVLFSLIALVEVVFIKFIFSFLKYANQLAMQLSKESSKNIKFTTMQIELKIFLKSAGLELSHMKFKEYDYATVIEINVTKYNDEAWQLAMLMNASMYTYSLGLSETNNGNTRFAQFLFKHEANKEVLALIRESKNL